MKIYLDLDGVMANFQKAIVEWCNIHHWDERASDEHWAIMEKVPNLFYTLDTMPDALMMFDVLYEAHKDNLEILTALPEPTGHFITADADKRMWVADVLHPNVKVNTVVGGKNKVKFLEENPGSILIDDYPRNIKLWIEHGGVGVLHVDPDSTIAKLKVLKVL
jgi:hypothetical protein